MSANKRTSDGIITHSTVITAAIAIGCFALAATSPQLVAQGGPYGMIPPVIPFNPKVPVFVPTDVTYPTVPFSTPALFALSGIQQLPNSSFPKESQLKGSSEWILVRARPQAEYNRPSVYSVTLNKGDILVTVKRPSNLAIVTIPYGKVSIASDGDAVVSFNNGILRVQNIDGLGKSVCAQVQPPGTEMKTIQLAPGFEFVAGDRKLGGLDLRPKDGIARRHFKFLEGGHLAVSEFSVDSAIKNSDLIADIRQNTTGVKERRILSDMSKMAAVLNYTRGEGGFSEER